MGTLHEDQCSFFIISRSFLLRMANVSDKTSQKNKTHILCSISLFENRAAYEIVWKNIVQQPGRPQIIWWILKIHIHNK